jgi:23S rRNA pseudouridine2604 synthase
VRLSKVMTERGLASRREADEWIDAGWVKVNGQMATLGQRVTPDVVIEVDPAARQQQARRVTVLLHKPIGYVSGQAEDGYEPASVLVTPANRWAEDPSRKEFHPGHARGLAPAGRLDIDSTGLLVLTQDGRIAKHLIGDDSEVEKEYLVRVQYTRPGQLPEEDLKRLNHGLELDGVKLRPAKVSWANEDQLRFVLREGRKRQIRRMCELVGLKVVGLKRVRIGSVVLGKLPRASGATCATMSASEPAACAGWAWPAPPPPARRPRPWPWPSAGRWRSSASIRPWSTGAWTSARPSPARPSGPGCRTT